MQRVQPKICAYIHVGSVETKPRVSSVHIPKHVWRNLIAAPQRHALNPASCVSVLSTAGGVAARTSQAWRVEDERRRNTVAGENHGLGVRHIVNLRVDSAQIIRGCSDRNE